MIQCFSYSSAFIEGGLHAVLLTVIRGRLHSGHFVLQNLQIDLLFLCIV